ncbi:unnamed protein product [Acidithrix sp. C25]|nr:unnamed protein product [Acidithrix sp. C25]
MRPILTCAGLYRVVFATEEEEIGIGLSFGSCDFLSNWTLAHE